MFFGWHTMPRRRVLKQSSSAMRIGTWWMHEFCVCQCVLYFRCKASIVSFRIRRRADATLSLCHSYNIVHFQSYPLQLRQSINSRASLGIWSVCLVSGLNTLNASHRSRAQITHGFVRMEVDSTESAHFRSRTCAPLVFFFVCFLYRGQTVVQSCRQFSSVRPTWAHMYYGIMRLTLHHRWEGKKETVVYSGTSCHRQ